MTISVLSTRFSIKFTLHGLIAPVEVKILCAMGHFGFTRSGETSPAVRVENVLFDLYWSNQEDLEFALKNYGEFRNFFLYNETWVYAWTIPYILGHLTAQSVNATLIAAGHPEYSNDGVHPKMLSGLGVFDKEDRTVSYFWTKYSGAGKELPTFVRAENLNFNLAYCAPPKTREDSVSDLTIFTDSFRDFWTWLCICISICFVGILSFSSFRKISFKGLLPIVSVLLSPGSSGVPAEESTRGRSKLFILWMFVSIIVTNFYSGHMTSLVISPSPEETVENLSDLEKNNYTLVYVNEAILTIVNSTAQGNSGNIYDPPSIKILQRLVNQAIVYAVPTELAFMEKMLEQDKVATVLGWPYAMLVATTINQLISKEKITNPGSVKSTKKCYIGKQLVPSGETFFGFLPPGSTLLERQFTKLIDSGIVDRWLREFYAIAYARSIQKRAMFKTPVNMDMEEELQAQNVSLKMAGKTVTIFVLWSTCILVASLSFIFEIIIT